MIFPWAFVFWVIAVVTVVVGLVAYYRARRGSSGEGIPVAHTERLTALPAYRRALTRYRVLVGGLAAAVLVLMGCSALLTMRPAEMSLVHPEPQKRDIVLCLDVSGSMIDYDSAVLDVFGELTTEFTGERVSLVVFNASAVTYFPLTSDYSYIERQLERLRSEFEDPEERYYSGTLIGEGSSLVGDGLASCVVRFDRTDSERSRSVILVTDNFVAGEQIFSLPDAAQLAADRGVRVYGINPGDASEKGYLDALAVEFEQAIVTSGGAYYALDDPSVVPSVVESIEAEQAAVIPGSPQVVRVEHPELAVIVAFFALAALMLLGWAVKR
ncbi:VWA domain-containing protein [soil metagenome]